MYDRCVALWVIAVNIHVHYRCITAVGVWVVVVNVYVNQVAVVYHGWRDRASCRRVCFLFVQELAQSCYTSAREDAEDIALVFVKFRRSFSAERKKLVA